MNEVHGDLEDPMCEHGNPLVYKPGRSNWCDKCYNAYLEIPEPDTENACANCGSRYHGECTNSKPFRPPAPKPPMEALNDTIVEIWEKGFAAAADAAGDCCGCNLYNKREEDPKRFGNPFKGETDD